MRSGIAAAAIVLFAAQAAYCEVLTFDDRSLSDKQVKASWADLFATAPPSGQPGDRDSSSIVAKVRDGSTTWTVMQLHDRGWCGMNTCSTRVFRNDEQVLSADMCSRGVDDGGIPWRLDPKARMLLACGDKIPLAGSAHSSAEPVLVEAPVSTKPTANVLGEPYDHNGSTMTIAHQDGLIVYAAPKRSIRGTVKPGTVLFRGDMSSPNRVAGTAYTFKAGCSPAAYPVSGKFAGGQFSGTLTLRGKAPVRAKSGCGVTGYSATSGNAKLVFAYEAPPEL